MNIVPQETAVVTPGQGAGQAGCKLFCAAIIAQWLGVTAHAVRKRLGGVAAADTPSVGGRAARGWPWYVLPGEWQKRITEIADRNGYRSPQAMLGSNQAGIWLPSVPFDQVQERFREEAKQWRDALLPVLTGQSGISAGELLALGLAECRRVFGRDVAESTWRRHFDLAVERDRNLQQWGRVDIYLSQDAFGHVPAGSGEQIETVTGDMGALTDAFSQVASPSRLTTEDRDAVFEALAKHPGDQAGALDYTFRALPGLCRTRKALAKWFKRKQQTLRARGDDLNLVKDGRPGRSGRKGKLLCPECEKIVTGATLDCDGNLPHAWRRLIKEQKICAPCRGKWHHDVRYNKSYVPQAVKKQVMPNVSAALDHRHGPKCARLNSPFLLRRPDIGPGDVFEADDLTQNHVFYVYEPGERGGYYVGRGEMLLLVDRRTQYPCAYILKCGEILPDGKQKRASYNALDVRELILRGHDRLGLPHEGYFFENGVWASRLIDGQKLVRGWEFNEWRQYERGLNEEGIIFNPLGKAVRHALPGNPRSKIIERAIRSLQEQMRPHKGFVGFNHRDYKPERVNEHLRLVKQGADPAEWFYSLTQIRNVLDAELMKFAKDVQNGKWLTEAGRGFSPLEAWINGIGGKPGLEKKGLRKLPITARWKLATHGRRVQVTGKGIRFEIGGKSLVFWGDELLPWKHKMLDVRLNCEEPELLHCLPPNDRVFTLTLREYGSDHAPQEELREALAARARWVRHGKVIHDNLPHPLVSNVVVDTEHSSEVHGIGGQINRDTAEHRAAVAEGAREEKRRTALLGEFGLGKDSGEKVSDRALKALERLKNGPGLEGILS